MSHIDVDSSPSLSSTGAMNAPSRVESSASAQGMNTAALMKS